MKLAIVGDVVEGKEEATLRRVRDFIEDFKGGQGVVMVAGSIRILSLVDRHTMDIGMPCILMGNVSKLAILNCDKALLLQTKAFSLAEMVSFCKQNNKTYMLIK